LCLGNLKLSSDQSFTSIAVTTHINLRHSGRQLYTPAESTTFVVVLLLKDIVASPVTCETQGLLNWDSLPVER
jgi:hypothetical protein